MDFSFIVPAHNAEKTIAQCIDSILKCAGSTKIEIIIIENGSEDKTSSICEAFVEKHPNIVSLKHSKKGVSNARNLGITISTGKWITFIDADDTVRGDLSSIKDIVLTNDCDMLICNHTINGKKNRIFSESYKEYSAETALKLLLKRPTKCLNICSKFYLKSALEKKNIRFSTELNFAEDSDFAINYILNSKIIGISNYYFYNVCTNTNSVSRSRKSSKIQEYLNALAVTKKRIYNSQLNLSNSFAVYVLTHLNIIMVRDVLLTEHLPFKDQIMILKNLINEEIIQDALNDMTFLNFNSLSMLPTALIKLKCYWLATVVFKLRVLYNELKEKKAKSGEENV